MLLYKNLACSVGCLDDDQLALHAVDVGTQLAAHDVVNSYFAVCIICYCTNTCIALLGYYIVIYCQTCCLVVVEVDGEQAERCDVIAIALSG